MSTTMSVVATTSPQKSQYSIEQLKAASWVAIDVSFTDFEVRAAVEPETDDDGIPVCDSEPATSWVAGYAEVFAVIDGVRAEMSFSWQANGDTEGDFSDLYRFNIDFKGQNDHAITLNFDFIDEDGDIIKGVSHDCDLVDLIEDMPGEVWHEEATRLCPDEPDAEQADKQNEIMEKDMEDQKQYSIERDNAPALEFTGVKIASVESSDNNAVGSSYSGSTGRYQKLRLYKTRGGKFICEKIDITRWQGERNRHFAEVCATESEVISFFGQKWLAKEMYEEANIKNVMTID